MSITGASLAAVEHRAVEQEVAFDMVRRAIPVAPLLMAASAAIWGIDGALSSGFAIVVVLVNLALSAVMLATAARISLAALMAAALGGYVVRLALVTAAVLLVKDLSWVEMLPLGLTIIVTHLGLLFWETRHVSLSLAYPGLKPGRG